jgi:hypothetical protein
MFHTEPQYSQKELQLFKEFQVAEYAYRLMAADIYRMAILNAFVTRRPESPATESLRRVYMAFTDGSRKRLTPEFDALIELRTPTQIALDNFAEKYGAFTQEELSIGKGVEEIRALPCEVPWMTPLGMGRIMIVGIRRHEGTVQFQLGNKKAVPYTDDKSTEADKTIWVTGDEFGDEWPA